MGTHPFHDLVGGRIAVWLDEAYGEYGRGRIRNAYDYAMLALNSTLFELRAAGGSLFARLEALERDGKLGPEVLAGARTREFLVHHDRGITDMDLSYMTEQDLREFLGFLESLYRSLRDRGVALAHDPSGS